MLLWEGDEVQPSQCLLHVWVMSSHSSPPLCVRKQKTEMQQPSQILQCWSRHSCFSSCFFSFVFAVFFFNLLVVDYQWKWCTNATRWYGVVVYWVSMSYRNHRWRHLIYIQPVGDMMAERTKEEALLLFQPPMFYHRHNTFVKKRKL